jgi:hypothetical protein
MIKFDKRNYEQEFTFDKPVLYIPIKSIDELNRLRQELITNKELSEEDIIIKQERMKFIVNNPLLISPVKLKDYFLFYSVINCLLIEKNKIADAKIISMSYLDYLIFLIENEKEHVYYTLLVTLLKLCCDVNFDYTKDKRGHAILHLNYVDYDKNDFEIIKKIICYQNMPDYDDSYIDPDLEKMIKETKRLQSNDIEMPSLEKQMASVVISSSCKYEDLFEMTIRKFVITLRQVDAKLHYEIYMSSDINGMIQCGKHIFNKEIEHWIYGKKKDKYDGALIKYDSFENEYGSVLGKS